MSVYSKQRHPCTQLFREQPLVRAAYIAPLQRCCAVAAPALATSCSSSASPPAMHAKTAAGRKKEENSCLSVDVLNKREEPCSDLAAAMCSPYCFHQPQRGCVL